MINISSFKIRQQIPYLANYDFPVLFFVGSMHVGGLLYFALSQASLPIEIILKSISTVLTLLFGIAVVLYQYKN